MVRNYTDVGNHIGAEEREPKYIWNGGNKEGGGRREIKETVRKQEKGWGGGRENPGLLTTKKV
jgi:hypothetical protein